MSGAMQKSICTQVRISSPSDAASHFNRPRTDGSIVIVCVPRQAIVSQVMYNVPSGYWILYQKWGKYQGELAAGLKVYWPGWYSISHIITRQVVTYNAPTRQCPTADNIMVNIDISLTFAIGPDIQAAYNFCYLLGPKRMDQYFSAQVEEAIRGLVFSVTHDQVNDLREEFAQGVLGSLQKKMERYGVQVKTAKITDVQLPRELMNRLENTTSFKTKIQEQRKRHENTIRVIKDGAQQEIEALVKTNARLKQDITAQIQRYETERKEKTEEMKGECSVKTLTARNEMEVVVAKTKGDLEASKLDAKKKGEELRRITAIKCKEKEVEAQNYASVKKLDSETILLDAEKKAEGIVIAAQAEAEASKNLVKQRKFDLDREKMAVMRKIAGNGRKFLTGKDGKNLFDQLIPAEN